MRLSADLGGRRLALILILALALTLTLTLAAVDVTRGLATTTGSSPSNAPL